MWDVMSSYSTLPRKLKATTHELVVVVKGNSGILLLDISEEIRVDNYYWLKGRLEKQLIFSRRWETWMDVAVQILPLSEDFAQCGLL